MPTRSAEANAMDTTDLPPPENQLAFIAPPFPPFNMAKIKDYVRRQEAKRPYGLHPLSTLSPLD